VSKIKVAVIGDFMQDIYWIGEASRLSPEAPIPVVKIKETKDFPGGAGNVAENLEALGVDVTWFIAGLKPKKNRLMVGDHQLARWDEYDRCLPVDKFKDSLQDFNAIIVADYGKGAINQDVIDYIKSHKEIVPIFVDTKGDPGVWSGVATAVFPNAKEYAQFSTEYLNGDFLVIQKRGHCGISMRRRVLDHDKTIWELESPSQARFVKSVNGAGDTVIAAFVYKYLRLHKNPNIQRTEAGFWGEVLDFANAAAAVSVEHEYTYAPTLKEVEERFYGNY